MEFLQGLSDRQAGDPASHRRHFDVRRLKTKDNLWGTRKGLEFIPKGKTKLYARREEQVDAATGQPLLVEHFNDRNEVVWRMRVHKAQAHKGVAMAEDVETESFTPVGRIVQRTRTTQVEVETE